MRVLVIEDDATSQELLKLRLEALDCDVVLAETAEDGLALASSAEPDLIITDLKLDGLLNKGVTVVDTLRADPKTSHIPLIVHSIFVSHPADMPEALPKADGYLLKPFKFQDLKSVLDAVKAPAAS